MLNQDAMLIYIRCIGLEALWLGYAMVIHTYFVCDYIPNILNMRRLLSHRNRALQYMTTEIDI